MSIFLCNQSYYYIEKPGDKDLLERWGEQDYGSFTATELIRLRQLCEAAEMYAQEKLEEHGFQVVSEDRQLIEALAEKRGF